MKNSKSQEKFFDRTPGLYPWSNFLTKVGFSKSYKPRDAKFKKYLDLLEMKKGDRVLDVGCGTGVFLARIAKTHGIEGVGVDISKNSIKIAQQWKSSRLKFQVGDAIRLPFADRSFDFVLSFDSLEHIEKQKISISEMARVLKPSGLLLVYTINKNQKYTWNYWLDKIGIDIHERVAHHPDLFLDPSWVKTEFKKNNIRTIKLELFNSFFSLAADELIMVLYSIFNKLNPFRFFSNIQIVIERTFLNIANIYSYIFLTLSEILDIPWNKLGYSNSFFILGRKSK